MECVFSAAHNFLLDWNALSFLLHPLPFHSFLSCSIQCHDSAANYKPISKNLTLKNIQFRLNFEMLVIACNILAWIIFFLLLGVNFEEQNKTQREQLCNFVGNNKRLMTSKTVASDDLLRKLCENISHLMIANRIK
jgi:hypothetical protein